jgi:hypothetical protein
MGGATGSTPWYTRVERRGFSEETRRLTLKRVKLKLGFTETLEANREIRGFNHEEE